jgi:hypothetical protein
MNALLEAFEKEFVPGIAGVSTTWRRDYDWKAADAISHDELSERMMNGPRILPWGKEVRLTGSPKDISQRLAVLKLNWDMDVDETFYVGDEQLQMSGLLNGDFEVSNGDTTLLAPLTFAGLALRGDLEENMFPCKWLELVGKERFTYDRTRLQFRLCWPNKHTVPSDYVTYYGGLTALSRR